MPAQIRVEPGEAPGEPVGHLPDPPGGDIHPEQARDQFGRALLGELPVRVQQRRGGLQVRAVGHRAPRTPAGI